MKGCTNLMFLYENSKFNEAYLDNMYRKSLSTGKYIAEVKLNNYQESLINPSSTEDEKKSAKIYNFSADRFEDINSIKEYGEGNRNKQTAFKSESLIQYNSLINTLKAFIKKQSILNFLVLIFVPISMLIIYYGTGNNIAFSASIVINVITNLFFIEKVYHHIKGRDSLICNINNSENLTDMKISFRYNKI